MHCQLMSAAACIKAKVSRDDDVTAEVSFTCQVCRLSLKSLRVSCFNSASSHQQQRRSNVVECYKSNDSFDKVECCRFGLLLLGNNALNFNQVKTPEHERGYRQNSCSDNQLTRNQTETGANLMERQCRCRCRIKSVIVQLLWVAAQLPTLYNTVEYPGNNFERILR